MSKSKDVQEVCIYIYKFTCAVFSSSFTSYSIFANTLFIVIWLFTENKYYFQYFSVLSELIQWWINYHQYYKNIIIYVMFAFLKKKKNGLHVSEKFHSPDSTGTISSTGRRKTLVKQTLLPLHCSRNKADPLHGMRLQRCCSIFTVRECRNRSLGN